MLRAWVLAGVLVAWGMPAWAQEESAVPGDTGAPVESIAAAEPVESAVSGETGDPVESAVPGEEGAPVESVEPGSGRPDLYLDMPDYLGGFEPDIVMTRGEEHLANLDAEDQTRIELEELLDEVGAGIEDMVSGYALVSREDFFSFVVAIRIEGVEPGSLLPAYLPILYDDLVEPAVIVGKVGGKDVVIVASLGENDESVDLFLYDQGDTLWMVQGPEDVVDVTIESLPGPTPPTRRDGARHQGESVGPHLELQIGRPWPMHVV